MTDLLDTHNQKKKAVRKKEPEYKRRSFEGLAPLTREIRNVTKPILGARGFSEVDILENWEDMVGSDLAQGVFPEKLVFDRDSRIHGTLYVKSAGGAFAMLFEHQKQRVIERVNFYFGYPAVSFIKIRQGALSVSKSHTYSIPLKLTPQEEEMLWQRVSGISDPELKQQAYDVGKAILLKEKRK